jgi:NAD(P)-dependent dehydrogenase (short-subunit alcohol dehydrogenase family)
MREDAGMIRTAVVTGAGTGIGRVVAQALLGAGYQVAVAGRRAEPLAEAVAGFDDRALVVPTDVRDPAAVERLFSAARDRFGRVDLLFNNAGVFGRSAPFEDVDPADFAEVVDINLTGAFLCAREAYRTMKAQDPRGGRIINNGSISAQVPRPQAVAYTASKHALTGLTKTISLEGRAYDIACGQIDIGNAATEMTDAMAAGIIQADGSTASEPRFDAAHVADAVLYMAGLPLDANVQFLTVMATKMPFIGRG